MRGCGQSFPNPFTTFGMSIHIIIVYSSSSPAMIRAFPMSIHPTNHNPLWLFFVVEGMRPTKRPNLHSAMEGHANMERIGKTPPYSYHCHVEGCLWRGNSKQAAYQHVHRIHAPLPYHLFWSPLRTEAEQREANRAKWRRKQERERKARACGDVSLSSSSLATPPIPTAVPVLARVGESRGTFDSCSCVILRPGNGRVIAGNVAEDTSEATHVAVTWVCDNLHRLTR